MAIRIPGADGERIGADEIGAEEWNAALARVVAGFAHATRNPLAAICGLVDLWADRVGDSDPAIEIVDRIRAQVERLEKLVRSFTSFDQSRPATIETRFVTDLLVAARDRLQSSGTDASQLPPLLPEASELEIQVDLEFGARVIAELWRNAMEAIPARKPPILRLSRGSRAEKGVREVQIEIVDYGPGVKARQTRRIFEPFFTTKGHRLGIGLTVAQMCSGRAGGRIAVRSASDGETVFTLVLAEGGK